MKIPYRVRKRIEPFAFSAALIAAIIWFLWLIFMPESAFAQAPSPTGRNPKLLWTPERQATWNRMRTEGHLFWNIVKAGADRTGTTTQRFDDIGQFATMAFQVTGDITYARRAITLLRKKFTEVTPPSANATRENGAEYVVLFDWLYPALDAGDKAAFVAFL